MISLSSVFAACLLGGNAEARDRLSLQGDPEAREPQR
jgi:hypothetical protein